MVKVLQTESIEGGGLYASKPGKYHVVVTEFTENPTKKDHTPINNAAVRVTYEILNGTDPDEKGKSGNVLFFEPKKPDDFNSKKLTRLVVALTGNHKPGEETELTEADAVGRQMVLDLATERSEDGKYENLNIKYLGLYHVDDPEVRDVPKDQEYISLIPDELRKKPVTDLVGAGASAPAAPAPGGVSLDDI